MIPDRTTYTGRPPAHWQRVARIVARVTGKRVGIDIATRMAMAQITGPLVHIAPGRGRDLSSARTSRALIAAATAREGENLSLRGHRLGIKTMCHRPSSSIAAGPPPAHAGS